MQFLYHPVISGRQMAFRFKPFGNLQGAFKQELGPHRSCFGNFDAGDNQVTLPLTVRGIRAGKTFGNRKTGLIALQGFAKLALRNKNAADPVKTHRQVSLPPTVRGV